MAIDTGDPGRLRKATVIGGDGRKLGTVAAVYHHDGTDRPEWVAVRTGLFGLDVSVVPLAAAQLRGEELHVPFDREQLRTAPHHGPGRELSPQEERDLFAHYGVPHGEPSTAADDAMTRSEEQLRVRTESQPVERVRLRKYVVTDYEQVTVTVRREEVRLEHEPVDGPGTAAGVDVGAAAEAGVPAEAGSGQVTEDHEMVLYAERPVVRTEAVPVERVRLVKETVTEQQLVDGQVRREQVELDTDGDPGGHRSP